MRLPSFAVVFVLAGLSVLSLHGPALAGPDSLKEARTAFERRDYDGALERLNAAIKANLQGRAVAYELRAVVQGYLGHPQEALADYEQLLQLDKRQENPAVLRRICLGLLVNLLSHAQEQVRGAAVTALAELGPEGTREAVATGLRDPSPRVRTFAMQTAGRLGLAASLPAVRNAVNDAEASVRIATFSTLGLSKAPGAVALVRRGLEDHDHIAQLVAREAMIRLNQALPLQPLLEAARDFSPAVRGAALGILGRLKDRSALPVLTLGLHDPDASVRSFAAGALGELGIPSAVPPLLEALNDEDPYVRNFAASSLGRLNARVAIPALWEAVKDSDSLVRLSAAEALVRLGEGQAALVFRELVKDPNYGVRSAAVGAMARATPAGAMSIALGALDDPAPRVRVAAVQALGRARGKDRIHAIPYLKRALADKDPTVRAFAAGHLGASGEEGTGRAED